MTPVILAGNKIDLAGRIVSSYDGQEMAKFYKSLFIETSALTGQNVNLCFEMIAKEVLRVKDIKTTSLGASNVYSSI